MHVIVSFRQLLRWTVRKASSSSAFRSLFQPRYIRRSLLCSSTSQSPLQSAQRSHELSPPSAEPATELSLHSLLDMGFTDTQAQQMYDTLSKITRRSAAKHALSTLTALLVLGLNPSTVLKLLEKCPELYTVKESQLQQRIGNLRKLGLGEGEITIASGGSVNELLCMMIKLAFFFPSGSLQRLVAYYPPLLTVPVKTVKHVVVFLREKCLFTIQQVTDILRDSPAIVVENLDHLEYKFQVSV